MNLYFHDIAQQLQRVSRSGVSWSIPEKIFGSLNPIALKLSGKPRSVRKSSTAGIRGSRSFRRATGRTNAAVEILIGDF
jgi:hypothetical protein